MAPKPKSTVLDPSEANPVESTHALATQLEQADRERRQSMFKVDERQWLALRMVASPRGPRRLANLFVVLLLLSMVAMLLLPWQQSVKGTGRVVAYAPLERQQTIDAAISGRIVRWNESIYEGMRVKQGDFLLEICDNDPEYLSRLKDQLKASQQKLDAANQMYAAYAGKVTAYEEAQEKAIEAANKQVEMADQKLAAERQGLIGAQAAELQSRANWQRQQDLNRDGLASKLNLEIAERSFREAESKVKQAEAYVSSAEAELASKQAEAIQKAREAQAKTDTARAEYQKALGEAALAQKELTDIEVKLARQESQVVAAPRDGTILRLLANQGGEMVSAGEPLLVLVPETAERAVEIWLSGNDAPLVTNGRHVRLQFEGWPAVQFAGWPSVAVGTFGGEVVNVDSTDDGKGLFRILVMPEEGGEWPADRYLRQGVRAQGWVLLNRVSLGYELWRRLNGFPPVVSMEEPKPSYGEEGKKKKSKL